MSKVSNITLISLADKEYYNMLKYLVKSSAKFFPQAKMYVTLVNMSPKYGNKLVKIHPNLEYKVEPVNFACDAQKRCYCTNRRADLFYNLRKSRPNDILMWIDADCIIRKDCSGLLQLIKKNDFDLCVREDNVPKYPNKPPTAINKKKPVKGFLGGAIIINATLGGTRFIQEYRKVVSQKSHLKIDRRIGTVKENKEVFKIWMLNQKQIYGVYKRNIKFIRLKMLPEKFCDTWFYDDSVIWAAIWNNKYEYRFENEYEKLK